MDQISRGVVYVAYGHPARLAAQESIASLREHNQQRISMEVQAVGEFVEGADFQTACERRDRGGRWAKVNLDTLSLFDDTLYLDADTRVCGSVMGLFDMLADGWEMVIAPSMYQGSDCLWHVDDAEREATFALYACEPLLQLQAGVMAFRKGERVSEFFEAWRREWLHFNNQDQAALLRALYHVPLRVWLLGRPWNGGTVVEHLFGRAKE